jgi:hypothetical protein
MLRNGLIRVNMPLLAGVALDAVRALGLSGQIRQSRANAQNGIASGARWIARAVAALQEQGHIHA